MLMFSTKSEFFTVDLFAKLEQVLCTIVIPLLHGHAFILDRSLIVSLGSF